MLDTPKDIQKKIGTIDGNRKCYLGKAISLKSLFGEVVIICSTAEEAEKISNLVMSSGAKIDKDKAQSVVVFSERFFSEDSQP